MVHFFFVEYHTTYQEDICVVDKGKEKAIQSKIGIKYFKRTVVGSSEMLYDQSQPTEVVEPVGIGEGKPMSADALKPDPEQVIGDGEHPKIRGVSTVATG